MPLLGSSQRGVTLIELMVTIAVMAILATLAIPAFTEFRERAAIRGAGDQLVSVWANARLEALKRDQAVSVAIRRNTTSMCIGAATGTAACDCFTANACNAGQYPTDPSDWRGVTMLGKPTLGPTDTDDIGLATIDPKLGHLSDDSDVGGVTIQSQSGTKYRLRLYVDRWARPYLCSPTDAPLALPDYATRTCAP
jgi:type IV fimbrial biogenesis protein FimT